MDKEINLHEEDDLLTFLLACVAVVSSPIAQEAREGHGARKRANKIGRGEEGKETFLPPLSPLPIVFLLFAFHAFTRLPRSHKGNGCYAGYFSVQFLASEANKNSNVRAEQLWFLHANNQFRFFSSIYSSYISIGNKHNWLILFAVRISSYDTLDASLESTHEFEARVLLRFSRALQTSCTHHNSINALQKAWTSCQLVSWKR